MKRRGQIVGGQVFLGNQGKAEKERNNQPQGAKKLSLHKNQFVLKISTGFLCSERK
jgi:hypothetical protein